MKGAPMTELLYLLTICLPLGMLLLIFGMKYLAAARQAQTRALAENAYRDLATKAAAAQSETAASLAAIQAELSAITTRLLAVEKILKEVG